MRLVMLRMGGASPQPAFVAGDHAFLLSEIASGAGYALAPSLLEAAVDADFQAAAHAAVESASVQARPLGTLATLDAPVPRPGKIICVGRNYAAHARETRNEIPTRPILFAKLANAIQGPGDLIVRPIEVADLDYEAELAVVIGRGGRRVDREEALSHVAGYMCANDVSARTAQLKSGDQWLRGKSFDTFCPTGPWLVTRDEIPSPQDLRIRCRVDGDTRQDASTADMIFDVATLISYCSDAFTLEPGDVILTGTPPGVAMGRDPSPWLQPGQLVEVEIERIGVIANRVVDEPGRPR